MGCNNSNVDDSTFLTEETINILYGKKKLFKFSVYEKDPNNCNKIIVPTTLDLTNTSVEVFSEDDPSTAIITDTPAKEDILNSALQKEGVALSYMIDTTLVVFESDKKYALIFSYDLPNGERDSKIVYFYVSSFKFINFNC